VVDGVASLALARFPRAFPDAPVGVPASAATSLPPLAGLGRGLFLALMLVALAGLAVHVWSGLRRGWLRGVALVAAAVALLPVGAEASGAELAAGALRAVVLLAVAALLLRHVLARNPVAYLLTGAWLAVALAAAPLLRQPGAFYTRGGWWLLALAALASAWWLWRRPRAARGVTGG
ncbi:MAG TPA: hypothetical protein VLW17_10680, partial [Thermoanaerobaculaceae bacterium]|nr:hypothetical protein [Thermoanaerobaculaceae bacterium]